MTFPAKIVASLLPLFLAGCFLHRNKAPDVPTAPPIDVSSKLPPPTQLPPPDLTIPPKPKVSDTKLPAQSPKPPAKRKKQPTNTDTQQASNGAPAVSAIGQLSTGDPANLRSQTEASISATERGLNGLNRQLDNQEQKTAAHIREFLKQARAALASGDVDGASTLAAKAKVLLTELVH